MSKTKKVLAILMAMCMLTGILSTAALAVTPSLQETINAAEAGSSIYWTTTKTESVTIDKDLTIRFTGTLSGAAAEPVITIKDGANVTIKNATLIAKFGDYVQYDMLNTLPPLLETNAVPAIRVEGGSTLNLIDSIVSGAEMIVPTTSSFWAVVGNGVELYGGSTLNVNDSAILGRYGVANGGTNFVNVAGTSILAGYFNGVKYAANYAISEGATRATVGEIADIILKDGITLDADETAIATRLMGNRAIATIENAPTVAPALETSCTDGALTVSFSFAKTEDIMWYPDTITLNGTTEELTYANGKYSASFTGIETGAYSFQISYHLMFDVGEKMYNKLGTIVEKINGYLPYVDGKIDSLIAEVTEVLDGDVEPQLVEAYEAIFTICNDYMDLSTPEGQAINELVGNTLRVIKRQLHYIVGDDIYEQVEGFAPESPKGNGLYFDLYDFVTEFEALTDIGDMIKYLRDNYDDVWALIYEDGSTTTAYARLTAIYDALNTQDITDLLDMVNTEEAFAGMRETFSIITEVKDLLADALSLLDKGITYYDRYVGGTTFQSIINFMTDANVDKGVAMLNNLDTYYGPDFKGRSIIIDDAVLEGTASVTNYITPEPTEFEYDSKVSGTGVINYTNKTTGDEGEISNQVLLGTNTGDEVEYSAEKLVNTCNFAFWMNDENGKVWSYDSELNIEVATDRSITAVYGDEEGDNVFFVDGHGKFIDSCYYGDFTDGYLPAVPGSIYNGNLIFSDWVVVKTIEGYQLTVLKAEYTATEATTYNVSVEGGNLWYKSTNEYVDGGAGIFGFQQIALVSATNTENFAYWADEEGTVCSYNANYAFVVTSDISLTAVYNEEEDAVAVNTVIGLDDEGALNVFAYRDINGDVKDDITVVEIGHVITRNAALADNELVPGVAGAVTQHESAGKVGYENGVYWSRLVNAATRYQGETIRARSFIRYEYNDAPDVLYTVYGDVESITL